MQSYQLLWLRSFEIFSHIHTNDLLRIAETSLIIIDECHHAVKNHPYTKIMRDHYHKAKVEREELPRILGLSASIVVKSVDEEAFRQQKSKLQSVMDATVETCEELTLKSFVSFAETRLVQYLRDDVLDNDDAVVRITSVIHRSREDLQKIKNTGVKRIENNISNKNTQATALESLKKDAKFFMNTIIGSIESLLELGLYTLHCMKHCLQEELFSKSSKTDQSFYEYNIRQQMELVTRQCLESVFSIVDDVFYPMRASERHKLLKYSCSKLLKLFEIIESGGFNRLSSNEMRCIVFVERKLTARALQVNF